MSENNKTPQIPVNDVHVATRGKNPENSEHFSAQKLT
jgi:hypothetical protein